MLTVGRVEEDQVEGDARFQAGAERGKVRGRGQVQAHEGGGRVRQAGAQVGFDEPAGSERAVDKQGEHRSPAQGLDAQRAGAGEQVEHPAARGPRPEQVEQGLAHPVAGRPDDIPAGTGRGQTAAAGAAAGDAHVRCSVACPTPRATGCPG